MRHSQEAGARDSHRLPIQSLGVFVEDAIVPIWIACINVHDKDVAPHALSPVLPATIVEAVPPLVGVVLSRDGKFDGFVECREDVAKALWAVFLPG